MIPSNKSLPCLSIKNAPNQADNFEIFQSCFLPKMRLSVVLKGRYLGYMSIRIQILLIENLAPFSVPDSIGQILVLVYWWLLAFLVYCRGQKNEYGCEVSIKVRIF